MAFFIAATVALGIVHKGQWTTGSGRVRDWSLSEDDTVLRDALALPGGDMTSKHARSNLNTVTFLCNAAV